MIKKAYIVTGLAYGDEGKGTMVDYLARTEELDTVVRFNGGAQAGHNVCLPTRHPGGPGGAAVTIHHEFRQLGSASLVPGVRTHLSEYHLVDPEWMFHEVEALGGHCGRNLWREGAISIDHRANIVTPFHRAANRIREEARQPPGMKGGRHGSVGMGIWEAESDKRASLGLTMGDVFKMTKREVEAAIHDIQTRKRQETYELWGKIPLRDGNPNARVLLDVMEIPMIAENMKILADIVMLTEGLPDRAERVVFEGAQGVLLDEKFGWHPHTTGSTTTSKNARAILSDANVPEEFITHVGCLRTYGTRHGAGPFIGEDKDVDFSEPHNRTGPWQGGWRQGYLDLVALRYAVDVDPEVDGIALSHMDRIKELGVDEWPVITDYLSLWNTFGGGIEVPKNRDEQAYLTQCMWSDVSPVIEYIPVCDLLDEIYAATARRVAYTASGPSHEDREKIWTLNAANLGIHARAA